MDVEQCVALVTGGNRGIGEAFVKVLLEERHAAKVYVGSRDEAAAASLVAAFPGRCVAIALDVTNDIQVRAAAERCSDVNLLVNNAGLFTNQLLIGAADMGCARAEMDVNYFGPLAMTRAFAPILARNGGGGIINVLSAAAIVALPNMGGYSPSKAAARMLSTSSRAELKGQGTGVTALIVGSVDTRMAAHVQGAKEDPRYIARVGLHAIERGVDELDTDRMAIEVRAALNLDPKGLEKRLAKLLHATILSTGR
jgi:NAD(P)-dependent dehydrogenase (short-subunit alcohol dehydrogenase family)